MKKAPNGGGSVERRGALWWVQVSLPRAPGEKLRRKRVPIANSEKMSRGQAAREGRKIAADVRAGRIVFDDKPSVSKPLAIGPTMTVRQVGEAWTSGKLYADYGAVDGLAPRKSGYIDGLTLAKHVYKVKTRGPSGPDFGDLPIASVTHDDARAVMGAQRPEEQALQTRRHTYNRIRQVFDFAEAPLRLRPDGSNPFTKRLRPRKVRGVDVDKVFTYWYPSEAVQVAACVDVLLARRVFYAVAVATGFDVSTIPLLSWADLDPKNRTLHQVRPKVGKTVFVYGNPAWLFDLLEAWRELSGAPPADAPRDALKSAPIFPREALAFEDGRESEGLQADMQRAKLTRAALFETTRTARRMRFHDLRATFATWARRAGWDQRDIDARTGHGSKAMAERYDRGARSLAELQEVPFPDLARAIPEFRAVLEKRAAVAHAVAQNRASERSIVEASGADKPNDSAKIVRRAGLEPARCYPLAPQGTQADPTDREGSENKGDRESPDPVATPETERGNRVCNADDGTQTANAELDAAANPIGSRKNSLASADADADLRAQIAAAILAGDDAEAARLMAELGKPKLRVVR